MPTMVLHDIGCSVVFEGGKYCGEVKQDGGIKEYQNMTTSLFHFYLHLLLFPLLHLHLHLLPLSLSSFFLLLSHSLCSFKNLSFNSK